MIGNQKFYIKINIFKCNYWIKKRNNMFYQALIKLYHIKHQLNIYKIKKKLREMNSSI